SISWSAYVVSLLQDLHVHLPVEFIASPWQPVHLADGSLGYGWINLPAVLIVGAISTLLIFGIRESSLFNNIIVALKVAAILTLIGVGFCRIKSDDDHPFSRSNEGRCGEFGWAGVLRAAGVLFFAYVGFGAVSTAVQETKNPQINNPIGILASFRICAC